MLRSQIKEKVEEDYEESIQRNQRGKMISTKRNAKTLIFLFVSALLLLLNVVNLPRYNMQSDALETNSNSNSNIDPAPNENAHSIVDGETSGVSQENSDNLMASSPAMALQDVQNISKNVDGEISGGTQQNSGNLTASSPAMALHDGQNISIAFVTFSHLSNISQFEHTILASANTWVPSESIYYVVLNQMWENKFIEWKKQKIENFNSTQINSTSATESIVGIHRIQPIYVDCPEGKFGESPCCKQEKGLVNFHKMHHYDEQSREAKYDWIFFADDDIYLVPIALEKYIRSLPYALPKQKEIIQSQLKNEEPLVLVQSPASFLGQFAYLKKRSPYRCSQDDEYRYPFGLAVVYNRAALERILSGLQQNGLVKQCIEYGVTHDVGNALLHWMYSIPSVRFRFPNAKQQLTESKHWNFRDDSIGYHGAGAHASLKMEWFHEMTRHGRKIVENMMKPPFNPAPYEGYYDWRNVNGFNQTATFEKYGDPGNWTEWHTMPIFDCKGLSPEGREKWNLTV